MHLSEIKVGNFRSLKSVHARLHPGLNVLVGRNNIGKTNLLKAIRMALGASASRGDAVWLDKDDFFKESPTDKTSRTISIELIFEGLSEAQRAHFYEIVEFDLQDPSTSKAIIRFEATWPAGKRQAAVKRSGGPSVPDAPEIPASLLESLPITFLPALRDAEAGLAPGYRSRLALLLRDLASRRGPATQTEIEAIFLSANLELEKRPLIQDTVTSLQLTTQGLAGSDYAASAITAAEVDFERILRTLRVQMEGAPIGGLDANGLGYNNLLYMAVVLEHLKDPHPDECPLLLVEEPEAHLHPQLAMLLAQYLALNTPGGKTPQTIVTTHSPTLAASVPPKRVHIFGTRTQTRDILCSSITSAGLDEKEERQLQRMMDITRATLYFAKGLILVEGISEALIIPILAKRLGYDLAQLHVSVLPVCGVSFRTFTKLFQPNLFEIPVAIVTDSDPELEVESPWSAAEPKRSNGEFVQSSRTTKLVSLFSNHPSVRVYCSKLTFEYDLAEAGDDNALLLAQIWQSCFENEPRTFNEKLLAAAGHERERKAMTVWRGICVASHSGSKAEFAHRLADHLATQSEGLWTCSVFAVPEYLKRAIEETVSRIPSHPNGGLTDGLADAGSTTSA